MFTFNHIRTKALDVQSRIQKELNAKGFRYLDSGAFAEVYGSPKQRHVVYKVGRWESSDGYVAYLKALSKLKAPNPFLPVIHGVNVVHGPGEYRSFYCVCMERLESLRRQHGAYKKMEGFKAVLDVDTDYEVGALVAVGARMVIPRPLRQAISVLKAASKSNSCLDWDLHDGNFMLRGDQIVCTDPLC